MKASGYVNLIKYIFPWALNASGIKTSYIERVGPVIVMVLLMKVIKILIYDLDSKLIHQYNTAMDNKPLEFFPTRHKVNWRQC